MGLGLGELAITVIVALPLPGEFRFPFRTAPTMRPAMIFAGQLTGVEGYLESAATGLLAGINAGRLAWGEAAVSPPPTTMLGALLRYLTSADPGTFQPINANFGLLPPPPRVVRGRGERNRLHGERAQADFRAWLHHP